MRHGEAGEKTLLSVIILGLREAKKLTSLATAQRRSMMILQAHGIALSWSQLMKQISQKAKQIVLSLANISATISKRL